MSYTFSIHENSCHIGFWANSNGESRDGHYPILHKLLNFMRSRGFKIGRDPRIQRDYKCLNKDHWYGRKGDLEFKASRYPAGFELEFYQNLVFENPHGGEYDFDRLQKMPYLVRLTFINECKHIKAFLESLDVQDTSDPIFKTTDDRVKFAFVKSCHHPQKSMDFQLEDLHGQTCEGSYNDHDKNGNILHDGDVKYFRCRRTGSLQRGVVYHNINNMWWVILNKYAYRNLADFDLFDPSADDFSNRRIKVANIPEKYRVRKDNLAKASAKELRNELKRRGHRRSDPGCATTANRYATAGGA